MPVHHVEFGGKLRELGAVAGEHVHPLVAELGAACAHAFGEVLADTVGNKEGGVLGPAVELLGGADLVVAQWFAMRLAGALLLRCPPADDAVDLDEGRAVRDALGFT